MKRIYRPSIEKYNIYTLFFMIILMFFPWIMLWYSNIKNQEFPNSEFIKFLLGSYIILVPIIIYIIIDNYKVYRTRKSINEFKKQAKKAEGHVIKIQKEYFETERFAKNQINNKRADRHYKVEVTYFNEDTNKFEIVSSQYFNWFKEKMLEKLNVNVFYIKNKAIIEFRKK